MIVNKIEFCIYWYRFLNKINAGTLRNVVLKTADHNYHPQLRAVFCTAIASKRQFLYLIGLTAFLLLIENTFKFQAIQHGFGFNSRRPRLETFSNWMNFLVGFVFDRPRNRKRILKCIFIVSLSVPGGVDLCQVSFLWLVEIQIKIVFILICHQDY